MSAPASGAREQVSRLLTLVPYLHSRDELSLQEAARILGVPASQVVRDLKVLLMCGLPGGYPDDLIDVDLDALEGPDAEGVVRISNADYLSRPLRLTPTEASALIVALRAVRASADEATREVVERTLAKLERAAAEGAAHQRIEVEVAAEDAAVRARLHQALQDGRQVRMTYWVPSRDDASSRTVDPVRLFSDQGQDYLQAWCHTAEDGRVFRLDRILDLTVLDSSVADHEVPPVALPDEFFRSGKGLASATLLLGPAARWVPEYYPVTAVRHREDGHTEVDLQVADERWLRRLLLRLAPEAQVLAPRSLAESQKRDAAAVLALYR